MDGRWKGALDSLKRLTETDDNVAPKNEGWLIMLESNIGRGRHWQWRLGHLQQLLQ